MTASPIIVNRGEFIDVLRALVRGRVLVQVNDRAGGCTIDGGIVYHSYAALVRYGLIREYDNPAGFGLLRYYRLSESGRDFALRACDAWRRRPLLERLAMRLLG